MTTALRRFACVLGMLAPVVIGPPAHCWSGLSSTAPRKIALAVLGLHAQKSELANMVADAIEVELIQSDRLKVLPSARIQKAAASLHIAPGELANPESIVKLCSALGATHLLTGRCFENQGRLVISLRVLDGTTGLPVRNGAVAAEGAQSAILPIVRSAVDEALKRLPLDAEPAGTADQTHAPRPDPASLASASTRPPASNDELAPLKAAGTLPASAKPGSPLTERDLADLVSRLAKGLGKESEATIETRKPAAPVERVRVLAAFVRLALSADNVADRKGALLDGPPDAQNVPTWARPNVEAALDEGWWDEDRPLKPLEPANWSFVAALLQRMPLVDLPAPAEDTIADGATGLIVDARDLQIQRSSNPRILDESGQALYPDRTHVPNMDYLLEHGLASYSDDEARASRAGARPVRVKAIRTAGPGRDDLVVSHEDAERIRTEDRRSHFLWRWNVVVLVKGRTLVQAAEGTKPPAPSP